jgi:hypothetical protein
MIAVGPLQDRFATSGRARQHFFMPAAVLLQHRKCDSLLKLTPRKSTHSIDCSGRVRPSVRFVNRFYGECVRGLQRAYNPNFPAEKCLHAGNIGQYVRMGA